MNIYRLTLLNGFLLGSLLPAMKEEVKYVPFHEGMFPAIRLILEKNIDLLPAHPAKDPDMRVLELCGLMNEPEQDTIVAQYEGKVIGFVTYLADDKCAYKLMTQCSTTQKIGFISLWAVAETERKKGIGLNLLKKAYEELKKAQSSYAYICVPSLNKYTLSILKKTKMFPFKIERHSIPHLDILYNTL